MNNSFSQLRYTIDFVRKQNLFSNWTSLICINTERLWRNVRLKPAVSEGVS
jgi:hypothetical protein